MSYQVLARKWRPRDFSGLVGQKHVVQALSNGLDQGRLHHAFLFTGTRGVGKTTIARILAKSLNCLEGVSSKPCGVCEHCVAIDEGRFVDLLEIDAASRTKVDDTREILDNVQYAPARGRFKVYLIDEVHMLSTHSFNALLKTLEEPPEHVKFVLATTDPQKIPVTILSRCMQFNLRRLAVDEISGQLEHILNDESVDFDAAALTLLARAADGSMRDGLSLLDQALAAGNGELKTESVAAMLGTVEQRHLHDILDALIAHDVSAALAAVEQVFSLARDLSTLLNDLAETLHRIALIQQVPDYRDDSRSDWGQLLRYASQFDTQDIQLFYQIVVTGRRDLALAPSLRSGAEMTLLRLFAFQPGEGEADSPGQSTSSARVGSAAQAAASTASVNASTSAVREDTAVQPRPAVESATLDPPNSAQVSAEAKSHSTIELPEAIQPEHWPALMERLELSIPVRTVAGMIALKQVQGDQFEFEVGADHLEMVNDRFKNSMAVALEKHFGSPRRVLVRAADQETVADLLTPAQLDQNARDKKQQDAESAVAADPVVRRLVDTFDAEIVKESIRPLD